MKKEIVAQRKVEVNPLIGQSIMELPTPSYVVDLDIIDQNIEVMKKKIKSKSTDWRIPVKAHKCPELAKYIMKQGQIINGIVVLTITEAEKFAEHGIRDIYLANVVK